MKRILLLSAVLAVLAGCQESLERRAERTMRDYSAKNCPLPLTNEIVMDSCAFETATHTLHYYYHLQGILDNDSALDTDAMRQMLTDGLKNETSTRVYKEAGYSFKYTYYSSKDPQKLLFEATMTAEDYR